MRCDFFLTVAKLNRCASAACRTSLERRSFPGVFADAKNTATMFGGKKNSKTDAKMPTESSAFCISAMDKKHDYTQCVDMLNLPDSLMLIAHADPASNGRY